MVRQGRQVPGLRPVAAKRTLDGYQIDVQRTAAENVASDQAMEQSGKALKGEDTQKAAADIQAKMQAECMKLPWPRRAAASRNTRRR